MCRNLHGFMKMSGHGVEIGNMKEMMEALSAVLQAKSEPKSQEQFLQDAITRLETERQAAEIGLSVLKAPVPEEGAKLVGLETLAPTDPSKYGVVTIVTYELASGEYLIEGKDYLTDEVKSYHSPNTHGIQGLIDAVREDLQAKSIASAEAKEATAKAKDSTEDQQADSQGTATS